MEMKIENEILGTFDIREEVLIALINSQAIQRLKGIDQAGYSKAFYVNSRNRYNHTIGVFLLLRKYKASLEEQIAGLLHDVSHYAFSHAIDYILQEGNVDKQDLQDRSKRKFLLNSDIPEILEKYGYDIELVADEENFPLLETSLPDVCADRLEYSFKDMVILLNIDIEEVRNMIKHLKINDVSRWYFDNVEIGYKFSKYFKTLNDEHYAGLNSAAMFKSIKDFVKHALLMKYIEEKDLERDDKYVLDKCLKHLKEDKLLKKYWKRMNEKDLFYEDENKYDEIIYCKSRVVDPLCLVGDQFIRVSSVYPEWESVVEEDILVKKHHLMARDN